MFSFSLDNHDVISLKLFELTVERTPEEEKLHRDVFLPSVDNMKLPESEHGGSWGKAPWPVRRLRAVGVWGDMQYSWAGLPLFRVLLRSTWSTCPCFLTCLRVTDEQTVDCLGFKLRHPERESLSSSSQKWGLDSLLVGPSHRAGSLILTCFSLAFLVTAPLPPLSGLALFLIVFFSLVFSVFAIVIGLILYNKWQDQSRKRFY